MGRGVEVLSGAARRPRGRGGGARVASAKCWFPLVFLAYRRPAAAAAAAAPAAAPPPGLPLSTPLQANGPTRRSLSDHWKVCEGREGISDATSICARAALRSTIIATLSRAKTSHWPVADERWWVSWPRGDNSWYPVYKRPWYPADIRLISLISGCRIRSRHGCFQRFFTFLLSGHCLLISG